MPNPARKFQRRKYQQDRRAQQAQKERAKMSTIAAEPRVEEKRFSEAELKAFTKKYGELKKAEAEVNEFLTFLREQHGVEAKDGWQLGQLGFFREVQAEARPHPVEKVALKATKPKKREMPVDEIKEELNPVGEALPVPALNGHG